MTAMADPHDHTLALTPGLNREGQEPFASLTPRTFAGQAHFGDSGPPGRTCRECVFWQATWAWAATKALGSGGTPKPARCSKFRTFAMCEGKAVPFHASACKHFAASDNPQPLRRPGC
jgi:hypothetical protein